MMHWAPACGCSSSWIVQKILSDYSFVMDVRSLDLQMSLGNVCSTGNSLIVVYGKLHNIILYEFPFLAAARADAYLEMRSFKFKDVLGQRKKWI